MPKKRSLIQSVVIIGVIALVFLSVSGDGLLDFSVTESGYSSAFEGPKATFAGVKYQNKYYTNQAWWDASLHRFDTVFKFDSDAASSGKPNIFGEETSVFIPEETLSYYQDWIPYDWLDDHEYVNNPVAIHEWEIDGSAYYMEQWLLRYYVSFSAEWNGDEKPSLIPFTNVNLYNDLEVWINMEMEPTWYIEGGGTAYFAVGKIQLAHNVLYSALDVDGNTADTRNSVSISPESTNSLLYLYYDAWGGERAESDVYTYKNKVLNDAYFTDDVNFRIDFNNFGVESGSDPFGIFWWTKGDVVTAAFDVTVFVIGEWSVQDIESDPDIYGRFTRQSYDLEGIINAVIGWFSSPYGWLIMLVIAFVLILVFAPWIFTLVLGGKRR